LCYRACPTARDPREVGKGLLVSPSPLLPVGPRGSRCWSVLLPLLDARPLDGVARRRLSP
jgi:hypothetical protein